MRRNPHKGTRREEGHCPSGTKLLTVAVAVGEWWDTTGIDIMPVEVVDRRSSPSKIPAGRSSIHISTVISRFSHHAFLAKSHAKEARQRLQGR